MHWRFDCSDRARRLVLALVVAIAACRPTGGGSVLRVTTVPADQDADVWVDGNYVGRVADLAREGAPKITLAPGSHRVEVRKTGRFPVQRTVRVVANGPAEVTLSAELLEDPQ